MQNYHKKNILIIKFGALGDVLLSMGAIGAILQHHPHDEVTILTEPNMLELLKKMTYHAKRRKIHFLTIKRKNYWQLPYLIWQLWRRAFDRVYDLQTSNYSRRLYRLLPKKPLWNGDIANNPWQDKNPERHHIHATERLSRQLSWAGVVRVKPPSVQYLTGRQFNFMHKHYFLLIIGGSAAKKRNQQILPLKHFIALAQWLEQQNILSVVIGLGDDDDKKAKLLLWHVPSAINLVNQTSLGDLAELARKAAGIVGNDTGSMHLAALAQLDRMRGRTAKKYGKKIAKRSRRRKTKKKAIPIVVIITPPTKVIESKPLGPSVRVLYRNQVNKISLATIIAELKKFN